MNSEVSAGELSSQRQSHYVLSMFTGGEPQEPENVRGQRVTDMDISWLRVFWVVFQILAGGS